MGDTKFLGTIQLNDDNLTDDNLTELWNIYKESVRNLTVDGYPLLWNLEGVELHPITVDGDVRPWAIWLDHIRTNFIEKYEINVVRSHLSYETTLSGRTFSGILHLKTYLVVTYEISDDVDSIILEVEHNSRRSMRFQVSCR